MSRSLRFIPEEGALVEVTCRTLHSRYFLRPDPALNDTILGVLGRAQRLYPVEICGFSFVSNHYHLLLWVPDAVGSRTNRKSLEEGLRRSDFDSGVLLDSQLKLQQVVDSGREKRVDALEFGAFACRSEWKLAGGDLCVCRYQIGK